MVVMIVGCATPMQNYALQSESQPYAEVRSNIDGAYGRNELIQVFVMGEGGCGMFNFDHITNQKRLFAIKKSNSEPQGYLRVAVDKPLRLRYYEETSGGGACEIMLEAKFESGQKYSIIGGFEYKDGVIPILTGTRSCSFAVMNESDGQPVNVKRLRKSTLCDK